MNGRVLIVEDQALMAMGSQVALCGRGWDVEPISRADGSARG